MTRVSQLDQLPHLDLAHLLLPDLVVAVRDQILSHLSTEPVRFLLHTSIRYLCQGKCQPSVSLSWGGEGSDLDMELLSQMAVLRVRRVPQLLLLLLVPHRAAAQHRHLRHRLLLQLLQ